MDHGVLDKPASVEQIVRLASQPFFDEHYPILRWFRTADVMVKQVGQSRMEELSTDLTII